MHPVLGYFYLVLALFAFFVAVFRLGAVVEGTLLIQFQWLESALQLRSASTSLSGALLYGIFQGIVGGAVIILPYLVPFLLGLAILEDIGYLPRVAFLMDAFMHRIGLHGRVGRTLPCAAGDGGAGQLASGGGAFQSEPL